MTLIFVNDLFLSKTMQAICWTLIHSLWQGLLLAIITGLIILSTKKAVSSIRYNILTGLFISFLISAFITFFIQYQKTNSGIGSINEMHVSQKSQNISQIISTDKTEEKLLTEKFVEFLNRNTYPIVAVWFIVLVFKSVKLGFNLKYIQTIKSRKTYEPSGHWKEMLQELASTLSMHKTVRILESGIVQVPVVVGFLKPMILLPVGLLANLPCGQVEAILLHELAHIKRKDYFVNLIQSIAEIIFFFNPAVFWLSSLIRDERENCCDDAAISVTNDKTKFIKALISFQELNTPTSGYALTFPGKKNQLLSRVKRIIHNENKKLNAMEKTILVVSIVCLSFLAMFSQAKLQAQTPTQKKADAVENKNDTVPAKSSASSKEKTVTEIEDGFSNINFRINDDDNRKESTIEATAKSGTRYKFTKVNDKLTELYIDDKKIPEDQYSNFTSIIEDIETAVVKRRELIKLQRQQNMELRKQNMAYQRKARELALKERSVQRTLENQHNLALKQQQLQERQMQKNVENLKTLELKHRELLDNGVEKHLETQKSLELKHRNLIEKGIEKNLENQKEMTIKMLELQAQHNMILKKNIKEQQDQELKMIEKANEMRKQQQEVHEKQLKEIEIRQQDLDEKIKTIKKQNDEKNKDDLNSLYQDQLKINNQLSEMYAQGLALNKGLNFKTNKSPVFGKKSSLFLKNSSQRAFQEQQRLYKRKATQQKIMLQKQQNSLKRITPVKKVSVGKFD